MLQPNPSDRPVETGVAEGRDERLKPSAPALALDPVWRAGRKLAEARSQLGLSLDEVAERIRVRREFLEALEQMNVKMLPGKAYALAFLRSYARALGIDERAIVDQFQDEVALSREEHDKPIRSPSSRPRRDRPWMAAAVLVVLGVGFVSWRALDQQRPVEPAQEQSAALNPEGASATPETAAAQRVVEIKAVSEAWLEARGPDGTVFLSRTLNVGDVYRPDASPGWTLHARDGAAFELFVNGAPAGPLGPAGMPVLGRAIDEIQPDAQAGLVRPRS
jgi:transcriptional regulator with XRE-family HTH domain